MVFTDDVVPQPSLAEITETDRLSFLRLPELLLKPLVRKIIDYEHRLAVILALLLLGGHFSFGYVYMVFLTELFDGFDITALLDLHDKTDSVAADTATEALVDAFGGADGERACLLVVERTEPNEVRAAFTQRDIITDYLFYLGCRVNPFYDFTRNQGMYDLFVVPQVHTEADVPLVEASTGVFLVRKIRVFVRIHQTEVVTTTQEITLVLESGTYAPCDVQSSERLVGIIGFVAVIVGVLYVLVVVFLGVYAHVEIDTALECRTGVEHQVGLFGNLELVLPIHE